LSGVKESVTPFALVREKNRLAGTVSSSIIQFVSSAIEDLSQSKDKLLNRLGLGVCARDPNRQSHAQWQLGRWESWGRFSMRDRISWNYFRIARE
jgi:hypothetical protein